MPYPASPPEPPALIAVPSEAVAYSKSAPKEASEPNLTHPPSQTAPFHPVVAPVVAVVAPPEATALPTTADFLQQRGASQAELLVPATTTSYFLNDAPQAPVFGGEAQQPTEQKQKFSVKVNPLKDQGQGIAGRRSSAIESITARSLTVPTPPSIARDFFTLADRDPAPATASTASPSVVYSLSGATRKADQAGEAAVMSGLNAAIELDEFAAETLAQEKTGTPGRPGLGIRAQVSGEPALLLPIPTLDQPTANPIPAPVPTPTQIPDQQEQPTALPPTQRVPANRLLPSPGAASSVGSVIELTADRQEYDEQRKIFTAEGKVLMRFQGALLDADRLQVNLENRLAVAEGNVALTRGNQVLRGQRLEYSFVQGTGSVLNARGELFVGDTKPNLAVGTRGDNEGITIARPVSDRVTAAQPTQNVSSPGGLSLGVGFGRDISRVAGGVPLGGQIRRLRFEAERIDFTPEGWVAKNIQITNDPFSPPELVLKADAATFKRISPLRDEVRTTHPRLVFDQRFTLPVLVPKIVLDRRREQRSPALVQFGYDDEERGGLFAEHSFEVLNSETVRFTLTPQIFLQKAISGGGSPFRSNTIRSNNGPLSAENFGFRAGLQITPGPFTSIRAKASLTSLDLTDVENHLRASVRARQFVGTHILAFEYSYRDRLFNGSLGFQTVQSSLGAVLLSPRILLGSSGIELTYQAGFQYVNAETDRLSLLSPDRTNNRIDLGRFEGAVRLYRAITLWQGQALPATPAEGLRYSPVPLRPYVNLSLEGRAVASAYTSGDSQQNLIASIGLSGQFGHFSRKFFDYTAFNISYTQLIGGGQSPFFFDRAVDNRILNLGIVQQIYGPFRVGFQTSINLDSNNQFSTDYILEYRRRTYAVVLRYNPVLAIGAIGFQLSDFNWTGGTDTFEGADITPVEGGVILRRDE